MKSHEPMSSIWLPTQIQTGFQSTLLAKGNSVLTAPQQHKPEFYPSHALLDGQGNKLPCACCREKSALPINRKEKVGVVWQFVSAYHWVKSCHVCTNNKLKQKHIANSFLYNEVIIKCKIQVRFQYSTDATTTGHLNANLERVLPPYCNALWMKYTSTISQILTRSSIMYIVVVK